MTPLQRKLPSGRVVKRSGQLPIPADERLSVVLLGSGPGFLGRFLSASPLNPRYTKTAIAPRLVQVPGKSRRAPSFGSAEALQARKDGLLTAVVVDAKLVGSPSEVIDLTPQAVFAKECLWQMTGQQRHELVLAAISAWIPAPPDGGEQLLFVELDPSVSPVRLRTRLTSLSKAETPIDHFLTELVNGRIEAVVKHDPANVILVSPDRRFLMRLDMADRRTGTVTKMIAALEAASKVFAGEKLSSEERAEFGDQGTDGFDVDALAAASGAESPGARNDPPKGVDSKRAARVEQYRTEQLKLAFPTRDGKAVKLGDLVSDVPTPEVKSRRAPGEFLDERVAQPKFDAISLSYLDSGMMDRDMAAVISSISEDPTVPHFVQKIERRDASDAMNLKETLSVQFRDPSGRSTTVHVDVPIVTRDGYMVMNGNKYNVTKQILAMPIIKVRPGEVLITTAYNKATVERFGQNASAMSSYIRLLAAKCDKAGAKGVKVQLASATAANAKYKSTVEYDDVARTVRSIRTPKAAFVFSRPALDAELAKNLDEKLKNKLAQTLDAYPGAHPIGYRADGKDQTVIVMRADGSIVMVRPTTEESSGLATLDSMIYDAVIEADPKADVPAPSVLARKYAYSRVKMLSQYLPTAVIVGYDLGLVPMLKRAGIDFQLVDSAAFRRGKYAGMDAIRFEDGVVVFNPRRIRDSLLMNGLKELDTEDMPMSDFAPGGNGWVEHIADRLGSPGHAKALVNYQASFIDPMTRDLLKSGGLPTDMAGVLLHASNMLEDNRHSEPNDMASYRLRGPELVNSILYKVLHKEMERVRATRESASPQKLMVNQNDVIRQVQGASNVEEVSELNPLLEAELRGKATWTGASGGLSDGRTVNRAMRAYHKSMKGIFGYYSPDSAEIGVKRTLAFGAAVKDVRGRFDHALAKSDAAQLLALGELISPFTAQHSDPPRIGMQSKQATHTMPIRKHTPLLVGSGAEKALASAIGNTYAKHLAS